MSNIRMVTHLETFAVMPQLFKLMPAKWAPIAARGEGRGPMYGEGASLLLRSHHPITQDNWLADLPVRETRDLEGWKNMQRLLERARRAIMAEQLARQYLSGVLARAMISRLDAGSTIFWHTDNGAYHERTARFHLPLVTNPGCILHSGPESIHVPIGALVFFNNKIRHCAANWGQAMRLHLIFEMYRLDKDDNEDPAV